jgi:hypothetical protein
MPNWVQNDIYLYGEEGTLAKFESSYDNENIAIDSFKSAEGEVLQKRYVFWNKDMQLVWYKNKSADGKFEVLV